MTGVKINAPVLIQYRKSCFVLIFQSCYFFFITEPVKEAPGKRKKEMANKSAPEAKKKKTDGRWCGIIRQCLFDGLLLHCWARYITVKGQDAEWGFFQHK